jgi:hypothetical protein
MDVDRAKAYHERRYQGKVTALDKLRGPRSYPGQGRRNTSGMPQGTCVRLLCGAADTQVYVEQIVNSLY